MVRDTEFTQGHGNDEGRSSKEDTQVGWKYPHEERIKLNVDGCSKGNPGVAGAGGVIRDHLGAWIGGLQGILVFVRQLMQSYRRSMLGFNLLGIEGLGRWIWNPIPKL